MFAVLFVCCAGPHLQASVLAQSSEKQAALIELFTSEGCSSCPPAEAWMSQLAKHPRLWRDFVPVAFHVTLWDKLGWKDRFARPEFAQRHRSYSAAWKSGSVYTPAFAVNGRESRSPQLPGGSGTGAGVLSIAQPSGGSVTLTYAPAAAAAAQWDVHVAMLANGVVSKVGRGENAGRDLRHDFVVVDYAREPMSSDGGTAQARYTLRGNDAAGSRTALAAWVTRRGDLAPVQATGGWLP